MKKCKYPNNFNHRQQYTENLTKVNERITHQENENFKLQALVEEYKSKLYNKTFPLYLDKEKKAPYKVFRQIQSLLRKNSRNKTE